ncbi:MAG TPA: cytochrome c maturation protein CcmE [Micavibrio sp.]|jgi:cytochrome c-type biogenesis protein CcmE
MTRKNQRLAAIILVLAGISAAAGLSLYALRGNVTFFMTPTDILAAGSAHKKPVRLGGMVVYGTVERKGMTTRFMVTDYANDLQVEYTGIVPDLFREGQGIVATGTVDRDGLFQASQLLAKHDEKYMPPEVTKALGKNKNTE